MDSRTRFESLVLPLQKDLYFGAMALARNESDALDLVQETLLKAWRGWASFNRGDNLKAWLFTILRNTHLDRCRQRRLEPVSFDPETAPELPAQATEAPPLADALPDNLFRALRSLSPAHQLLLLLCDIEGLRYKEIAEVLSIPIGSVMSGLFNARSRLKKALSR